MGRKAALGMVVGLLAVLSGMAPARAETPVDLELVLAVDVSGSISDENAWLQRRGYARALKDRRVIEAIQGGALGRIAVTYIEWAGVDTQRTVVDWRVIDGPASASDFARALDGKPTVTEDRTSISAAIDHAASLFGGNGFEGTREVIDISGDGENNVGRPVTLARDDAVGRGITINGLPIVQGGLLPWSEDRERLPFLDSYYRDKVIGGPGAFVVVVKGYNDFADAIIAKLLKEIAALPE